MYCLLVTLDPLVAGPHIRSPHSLSKTFRWGFQILMALHCVGMDFQSEKVFSYHNMPNAERVDITTIHFENDVVLGFKCCSN